MGYTAPLTVITGDLATAAQYNTYTKDNIIAVYGGAMSIASQATRDFVYAASATQLARLAQGSALQVPRINAAGNAWEFASIVTKVVQIVTATYATETSSSTSALADTGLTATITPTSASNKVLVVVFQAGCAKASGDTQLVLALNAAGSDIVTLENWGGKTSSVALNAFGAAGLVYLHSPATASAITYKTRYASGANIATVYVQVASATSSICLFEVTP